MENVPISKIFMEAVEMTNRSVIGLFSYNKRGGITLF